jgi:hypothetical protein
MPEFKNLQWQEGSSDEGCEILRPDLLKQQADALDETERSVAEEKDADASQHVVVDQIGFFEQKPDETSFRIHAEAVCDLLDDIAYVFAQQSEQAKADADQQGCLEELVYGDELKPSIAFFSTSSASQGTLAPELSERTRKSGLPVMSNLCDRHNGYFYVN